MRVIRKRVHNRSKVFLAAYRATFSVTRAAEAADIERVMHYRWLESDPEYKAEFEVAHRETMQILEDEITRRGHEGYEEPLVYQGQFCYAAYNKKTGKGIGPPLAIRKWSDQLLLARARAEMPKYRERQLHEGTVNLNVTKYKGTMQDLLATYRELTQAGDSEA